MYCAMGVASHRVWKAGGGPVPLTLYAVQLALNLAWRWADGVGWLELPVCDGE
jgi:benzodiazapine receptor